MENENLTQDEIFEKEERCIKSIKNVARAAGMRVVTGGILLAVVVLNDFSLWIYLMMAFVFLLILGSIVPLLSELKKQIGELVRLRSLEE